MTAPPPLFGGDEAVESFIRGYCGWHIAPWFTETVTVIAGGASVLLPSLQVQFIDSVFDVYDAPLVATFARSGVLYADRGVWWSGMVTVTFTHGYDECPAELTDVAARLSKAATSGVAAGASLRVGNVQVSGGGSTVGGLDPYCASVLDRYRVR